ncbi:MAG: sigma-70 family RNA polymerase sigma factor [Asticcacaulis sp.]
MRTLPGTIEGLYADHSQWLSNWLRRRLQCPERAADISQDTFVRLIERLPEIAPASPRSLLATIARRLMIDDIRRREIERAVIESYALYGTDCDTLTPERIWEAVSFLDEVLIVLNALPPQTRQVLLLRRIDGLSQDEIAVALNISSRTVRRHIVAATVEFYKLMAQ